MTRVLVCGGRDYNDLQKIFDVLYYLDGPQHGRGPITCVIHGAAIGADSLAALWAKKVGKQGLPYPADWEKHGKSAGPIRNAKMLREGKPDLVVAFPGGKGTAAGFPNRARAAPDASRD